MKLVLAEKPSVAQSIAKVLGAAKREDGYLEGNGYVVSWCVGHLVELAQPEVYDAKYSKWAYQAIELQVFDVAHHSEIHNKNLPAQPGQDYCNSYEWYHLTLGFVKAHPKTFLTQYFDEHLGCAKLALECFLSTIPLDHSVSKILPGSQVLGH